MRRFDDLINHLQANRQMRMSLQDDKKPSVSCSPGALEFNSTLVASPGQGEGGITLSDHKGNIADVSKRHITRRDKKSSPSVLTSIKKQSEPISNQRIRFGFAGTFAFVNLPSFVTRTDRFTSPGPCRHRSKNRSQRHVTKITRHQS